MLLKISNYKIKYYKFEQFYQHFILTVKSQVIYNQGAVQQEVDVKVKKKHQLPKLAGKGSKLNHPVVMTVHRPCGLSASNYCMFRFNLFCFLYHQKTVFLPSDQHKLIYLNIYCRSACYTEHAANRKNACNSDHHLEYNKKFNIFASCKLSGTTYSIKLNLKKAN